MENLDEIQSIIECTVQRAVGELKRNKLVSEGRRTPFQKTETLLYNYNNFLSAIKDKEEQINEIKQYGIRKHTSSGMGSSVGFVEVKTDKEKAEEKIELLQYSINTTKAFIRVIDEALETLKNEPYYNLIPMRYFERRTLEDIAEYFDVDTSTISRQKNNLINRLQIRLFSDEVIECIFFS